MTTLLAPLGNPTFRRLFAARVTALTGTGLTTVALTLLAWDLAGERAGTVLGTALALKMVSYVVVAPVVGAYAERLPRRGLLVALDVVRAGLVLCLPLVTEIWQIYLLIVLLNACAAGFTPVYQATIPDVLEDEAEYTEALSLSRLTYDLEALISPSLAALVLILISYDALFVANALALCASALLVLSIRFPRAAASERPEGVLFNLAYGIRGYLATPRLRGLLFLTGGVAAASAMVIVNTVVYVRDRLGGTEADTALAFAASGAGSMLAAIAVPRILSRISERTVMSAGCGLLAVSLAGGILGPGLAGLLALWLAIGVGSSLVQTPAGRLLRRSCQPADRPAFFSAQFALSHACWLVTYPLAGWLGVGIGMEATFAVFAGLAVICSLSARRVWRGDEVTELDHIHDALDHEHLHASDDHHRHEHAGWEGAEPHRHPHRHDATRHRHVFRIDLHHPRYPD